MKMSRYFLLIAVVCLLPSLVFAAGDAAKGKDVYMAKCKSCHGADGTPSPSMAKSMGIKPMNDKAIQAKSDADLKKAVTDGIGKMPKQASVTGAAVDDVIAFVRTLK